MGSTSWFDDLPVLGKMAPSAAAQKLRELGEDSAADAVDSGAQRRGVTFGGSGWSLFEPKPWQHTAHAFGHIALIAAGSDVLPIRSASAIPADAGLKNARIKITLDHLRVAAYPGGGLHHVLFDFYAQNEAQGATEHVHFNNTYRVREGERAAVVGYPIFVGLGVGTEGVAFKCYTVNVKNDADEAFLSFLDSDAFKRGLKLASTAQPAIGLLSETALGMTRAIASRNRNVPVQEFFLGLDFGGIATRARLAEGSYIAVQIPETLQVVWNWSDWEFHANVGQVVSRTNPSQLIPYNYIVFSVSRSDP